MESTVSKPFLSRTALRGILDYSQPKTVLSDKFSPMAVSCFGSDQIDINELYFKGNSAASDRPAFRPFLRLAVLGRYGYETVGVTLREDWPGGFRLHGETEEWNIRQDVFFLSDKSLRITYLLIPIGESRLPDALVFGGINQGEVTVSATMAAYEQGQEIELEFLRIYQMYVSKTEAHFRARLKIASTGGFLFAEIRDGTPFPTLPFLPAPDNTENITQSDKMQWQGLLRFTAQKNGSYSAEVNVACEYNGSEPKFLTDSICLDDAVTRWECMLNRLPIPAEDTVQTRRKAAQAFLTISTAGIRSRGYGNFSETLGLCACATTWASTDFFWDHMISAAALSILDGDHLQNAVIHFLQHCSGGRLSPGILMAYPVYGETETPPDGCYAPVAGWAVYKTLLCSPHKPDIALLYPYLKALNRAWFTTMDRDGDGIPEWMNSGHPADNSPLFDLYTPKPGVTNFPIPPFISVNLTSYLYQDCKILASMAQTLLLEDELILWNTEIARLETILLEKCWNEEDSFFYDLDVNGKQNKVKTFFGFLPLWAGVPLEKEKINKVIKLHMLNPCEFWGEIPFPSVAYCEPTYDPDGYWRGRTWPHLYFWNVEILHRYGYHAEGVLARNRFLALVASDRTHTENISTDYRNLTPGEPHYNWGAAIDLFWYYNWQENPVAL